MSFYGGASTVGDDEFCIGGERMLDDLLTGESGDTESVSGWVQSAEEDDFQEVDHVAVRRENESVVRENLVETSFHYQTSGRGQAYAMSTRGRYPVSGTVKGEMKDEKLFSCSETMYLTSPRDEVLCEKLKAGRVVSNIVIKTGGGKSSILPAHIASSCGMRVLLIVPDANLKESGGKRLSLVLAPTRMWSDKRLSALVLLTPAEVIGRFMGSGWDDVDSYFDVIVVDESHMPVAQMYSLRAALVTKNIGQISLLFLTATTGGADMQTVVEPEYTDKILEDVVSEDGFVEGPYAVDRTLILVESDERVRNVTRLLNGHGLDVYTLESSATNVVLDSVSKALLAATASMRFLVAHEKFGCSYNLPVVRVLTTATTSVLVQRDGEWFYGPSLLSQVEVDQQMGRAGRGIVDASRRGVVFARKGSLPPYRVLRPSEYFSTYVMLVAMNIRPKKVIADAVREELPFGITPRVAAGLLSMCTFLPARVTVRLLDGEARFPRRIVTGAKQYAHVGGLTPIGDLAQPLGYSSWPEVKLDDVLGCGGDFVVKVPIKARGSLAVNLALLCASSEGIFKPRTTYVLEMSGYESGPDVGKKPGKMRRMLDLPTVYPYDLVTEEPVIDVGEYALEVPLADQPRYGRRNAAFVPSVVTEHLASGGYEVGVPTVSHGVIGGIDVVRLDFVKSPVEMHSPGGTVAFTIDGRIWERMVSGEALSQVMCGKLMDSIKGNVNAFANCDAFSVWGNPWISILRTFQEEVILDLIRTKNSSSWLVTFLAALWKRYVNGMRKAMLESHQTMNLWSELVYKFKRSLRDKYKVAGVSSKLPAVAQSEEFHERLCDIREGFSRVLDAMQDKGLFDTTRVAEIQRVLPISKRLSNPIHNVVMSGRARAMSDQDKNRLVRRFQTYSDVSKYS